MAARTVGATLPRLKEWRVRRLMTQTQLASGVALADTVTKAEHEGP